MLLTHAIEPTPMRSLTGRRDREFAMLVETAMRKPSHIEAYMTDLTDMEHRMLIHIFGDDAIKVITGAAR